MPASEDMGRSRIKTFHSYVRRIGDEFVAAGGSKHGRPKVGSIPFFLSYFWQIQDGLTWPVYYTNGVNTLIDLNLWQPTRELAAEYIAYKHLHEELTPPLFTQESGRPFDLYGVEHVFWFNGGNPQLRRSTRRGGRKLDRGAGCVRHGGRPHASLST